LPAIIYVEGTMRFRTAVLMTITLLASTAVSGQTTPGEIWLKDMTERDRTTYLAGFQAALTLYYAAMTVVVDVGTVNEELVSRGRLINQGLASLNLSADQKRRLLAANEMYFGGLDISQSGRRVAAQVMTELYKDPANTHINPGYILPVALMRLHGRPEEEVRGALEARRRAEAPK
jgi:hypothetical protein